MSNSTVNGRPTTGQLIFIPALITLAVTMLRLLGELRGWSPALFNRNPGGFFALVGIAWLVPIFGIYFAMKLAKSGDGPDRAGKSILFSILAIVCFIVIGVLAGLLKLSFKDMILSLVPSSAVALLVAWRAWPALCKTLFAYGVVARIPVIIVMWLAIRGNWGTHYDTPSPEAPAMDWWSEFLWTGLIPQLTLWIAYTVLIGLLFGAVAAALAVRRKPAAAVS